MSDWLDVAPVNGWQDGKCHKVMLEDVDVLVFRRGDAFYAIENRCTHDDAPLEGLPLDGDQVICPRHGARFCIKTGRAMTPPAHGAVDCFPVRVDNGRVAIRDARWD